MLSLISLSSHSLCMYICLCSIFRLCKSYVMNFNYKICNNKIFFLKKIINKKKYLIIILIQIYIIKYLIFQCICIRKYCQCSTVGHLSTWRLNRMSPNRWSHLLANMHFPVIECGALFSHTLTVHITLYFIFLSSIAVNHYK